jgi:VCBS repeat-containing protein
MEERILHSADLGPLLLGSAVNDSRALDATDAVAQTQRNEIAFIDAALPDADGLRADLLAQQAAGRPIEIVTIDNGSDGLALITQTLAGRHDITAVHVLAHGSDGQLQLGSTTLDAQTLLQRAGEIAGWSSALTADADLLLYGCDVAQTARGRAFVQDLSVLTGADVAASTDLTGATASGGNWILEYRIGRVEATLAPTAWEQLRWQGTLATYTVTTTTDVVGSSLLVGSLRWAISQANANLGTDTINFSVNGTFNMEVLVSGDDNNATGDFDIKDSVNIVGNGTGNTVINGNGFDRVFDLRGGTVTMSGLTIQGGKSNTGAGIRIDSSVTATLTDVVIQNNVGSGSSKGAGIYNDGALTIQNAIVQNNGNTISGDVDGAGIYNDTDATLTVRNVEIRNNVSANGKDGGGLYLNKGWVTLENVTLAGNQAKRGGGLFNASSTQTYLVNSTISGNSATSEGGGIWSDKQTYLDHVTVAYNTAPAGKGGGVYQNGGNVRPESSIFALNTGGNANVALNSWGYNLSDDTSPGFTWSGDKSNVAAGLLPLANNGGFARTHAIAAGSAALNAANPSTSLSADQRGVSYYGGRADIGAYEYNPYGFAPTISAVANRSIAEDTPLGPLALTIGDAETASSSLVVSATSSNTALVPNANISIGGSGSNRTISLTPAPNANSSTNGGPTTITLSVSDGGNVTTTTFTVTVTAVNDAPTISLPAAQTVDEDATLTLSGANAPSIGDVDAGSASLQATLSVAHGWLTLSGTGGLSFVSGSGSNNASMTFSGTQAAINAALAGMQYRPVANYNGPDQIDLTVNDLGNTGSGGAKTTSGSLAITVSAVNDAPVLGLPGPQVTPQTVARTFSAAGGNAITVSDIDAGIAPIQLTLNTGSSTIGTLTLATTSGLTFSGGTGSGDVSMTFSGSVTAINAALDGLVFTPDAAFTGSMSLQIGADDLGGSGSGGARAVNGAVAVSVSPDLAPVLTLNRTSFIFNENDAATRLDPLLNVVDGDNATLASAIVSISGGYAGAEDELRFTNNPATMGNIAGSYSAGVLTLESAGASATLAEWQTALASVAYINLSEAPDTTLRMVTLTVNDGIADSAVVRIGISVVAANDAPVLAGANDLAPIDEDLTSNDGTLVSTLIAGHVSDADGTPNIGIAVTGVSNSNGTWQYTTNLNAGGGATWTAFGSPSDASARLLAANADTAVRFVPAPNWNGATGAGLTFRAWDQTFGTAGAAADASSNGGGTAFSLATASSGVTVTPVNDAPLANGSASLAAVDEDTLAPAGASVVSLFVGNFDDSADTGNPAQNQLAGVAVRGITVEASQGHWQYSTDGGASWSNFGAVSDANALSLGLTDRLRFLPAADYNGTPNSLSVRLIDNSVAVSGGAAIDVSGNGGTSAYSAGIVALATSINAVNDPPVITSNGGGPNASLSVAENTTAVTTVVATDVEGSPLLYSISGGVDAARFAIDASTGVLRFVVPPNYEAPTDVGPTNNVYEVTVRASDGSLYAEQAIAVTVTDVTEALRTTGEQRVNTGILGTQETSAADRGSPRAVAMSPAGDYVVVWSSQGQDLSGWGVYGQRFNKNGAPVGGEFRVNQVTTNDQVWATVAMDVSGRFAVSWTSTSQDGTPQSVYARLYNADGSNNGGEFRVNTTNTGNQYNSSVAMDANGNFVVVWQGEGPGDTDGIFGRRFNADGTAIDVTEFRVNTDLLRPHYDASVSMNASGAFAVMWDDNAGVQLRRYNSSGAAIGGEINVDSGLSAGNGSIALADDGSLVVVWREGTLDTDVYMRRYSNAGVPAAAVRVNSTALLSNQTSPSITMDGTGNYIVAWEGNGPGDSSGVFAQKYNAAGVAVGGEFRINSTTLGSQAKVSLAILDLNNFVAAWSGQGPGDTSGVFARQYGTLSFAPVITSNGGGETAAIGIAENTSAVTTVTATDADLPAQTLTYSIVGGADQLKFGIDGSTGVLRFLTAPDFDIAGDFDADNIYDVIVQVSDGTLTTSQAIAVSVTNVNDNAPVSAAASAVGPEDTLLTVTLSASDADSSVASFTVQALPANGTLYVDAARSTAVVAGTAYLASSDALTLYFWPGSNWNGSTSFNFFATDDLGLAGAAANASLTITAVNDAPVAADASASTGENTVLNASVPAASDVDGTIASYALASGVGAGNGSLTFNADGSYVFNPGSDFDALAAGASRDVTFTYTAIDNLGLASAPATVTVTVNGSNDAALLGADVVNLTEADSAAAISASGVLTISDVDSPATFVAQTGTAGSYGSFSIDAAGAWTYTASSAHDEFVAGNNYAESFSVSSADGTTTSVTINIVGSNDAPVASAASVSTGENTVLNASVPAASDVDGSIASYALTSGVGAGNGNLTFSADGSYVFNPRSDFDALAAGASRDVSFTYTAIDDLGQASVPVTVTVTVTGSNDAPVAAAASASGAEDTLLPVVLGGSDVDGSVASFTVQTLPANGTLYLDAASATAVAMGTAYAATANALTLYFAPAADWNGSTAFDFVATDDLGLAGAAANASLTITAVNDAPVAADASASTGENTVLNASVPAASDVDGSIASYALTSGVGAGNGSLTFNADGTYVFNPGSDFDALAAGASRDVTFTYTAIDNLGQASALATVNVTVNGSNDAPVQATPIANQSATEDVGFGFTLPAGTFTDADAGDTLSYAARLSSGAALPSWLTFNAATRSFSGTPANADVGAITVRITATDTANATAFGDFSLLVANANDAPVFNGPIASQSATEDVAFSFTLPAGTFTDPDARDTLSYAARLSSGAVLPSWLTFNAATRTFSGTPANGDVGAITIRVTATDTANATAFGDFALAVANSNDAPVFNGPIASQAAVQDAAFRFTVPAAAFTDEDAGDTLTYSAALASGGPLPSWLTFDANTLSFSGTPQSGDVGQVAVQLTATDSSGASAQALFVIRVAAPQVPAPVTPVQPAATPAEPAPLYVAPDAVASRPQTSAPPVVTPGRTATDFAAEFGEGHGATTAVVTGARLNVEPASASRLASSSDTVLADVAVPQFAGIAPSALSQLLGNDELQRKFDEMRRQMNESDDLRRMVAESGVVLSAGLSIGYVVWLVRGGVLVSSMVSALPAWQMIDPMPILAAARKSDRKARFEREEPELERLFDDASSGHDEAGADLDAREVVRTGATTPTQAQREPGDRDRSTEVNA